MKQIWCFAVLAMVFLAIGICAAEVPNLLGKWTGSWSAYDEGIGYSNLTENGSFILTFVEQEEPHLRRKYDIQAGERDGD